MNTTSKSDIGEGCHEACCASDGSQRAELLRQLGWLQGITLVWMAAECCGSLVASFQAHSMALLAFGADSLVEMLSATVVLLQFLPRFPLRKAHADRLAAILLYALAVAVVGIAALAFGSPVKTSCLGMGITAAALVAMPVLAALKRRQAQRLNNRALAADATQSATCAYLAAVTLAGLVANSLWHIGWVDTVAALAAVPILLLEGRRTWRGEGCGCGG
jgi:divalent metal cation (Fe/Co/Zn/Cd) transporter